MNIQQPTPNIGNQPNTNPAPMMPGSSPVPSAMPSPNGPAPGSSPIGGTPQNMNTPKSPAPGNSRTTPPPAMPGAQPIKTYPPLNQNLGKSKSAPKSSKGNHNHWAMFILFFILTFAITIGVVYAGYFFMIKGSDDDINTKIDNLNSQVTTLRSQIQAIEESKDDEDETEPTSTTGTSTMSKTETAALFSTVATWVDEDPSTSPPTITCTDGTTYADTNKIYSLQHDIDQAAGEDYQTYLDNTKQIILGDGWVLCSTEATTTDTPAAQTNEVYKKDDMHLFLIGAYSEGAGSSVNVQFEYSE